MRGATLVYKSVCRLTLERDEHAQADELKRDLRALMTCAYFDVMRGATLVYKSVCRLTLERDEHAQADELKRDLRALMKRGMLHAPLRHMRAAEYITVLKTMKTYLLERW